MCAVPIEKDEGCAQMMCKRCKHVFCWYCLASLDVSVNFALFIVRLVTNKFFALHRMTSCCVTTTKALAKTSSDIRVHRSFGIERKSLGFLRALEFCCLSRRHFYCSVSCATVHDTSFRLYRLCLFLSGSVHCLLQVQNRRDDDDLVKA